MRTRGLVILGVLVWAGAVSGCGAVLGSGSEGRFGTRAAASEPAVSVERFLEAANTGDVEAMARLFGNASGTVAETVGGRLECAARGVGERLRLSAPCIRWASVEAQMSTVAALLQHDRHRVRPPAQVGGRTSPAIRYDVELTRWGAGESAIPMVVVLDRKGRWVVESIGLDGLTPRAPLSPQAR
jgi:hypothetical protein